MVDGTIVSSWNLAAQILMQMAEQMTESEQRGRKKTLKTQNISLSIPVEAFWFIRKVIRFTNSWNVSW